MIDSTWVPSNGFRRGWISASVGGVDDGGSLGQHGGGRCAAVVGRRLRQRCYTGRPKEMVER